ncbi:MAG: hypothetical protein AAFQ98_10900 [Bacteroidota bacterium]
MPFLLFITLWGAYSHSPTQAQRFAGQWYIEEIDQTTLKIYQASDGFWYGKIIDSAEEDNIGDLLLEKLSYQEEEGTLEGNIIQQFSGITATAILELRAPGTLEMTISKFFMTKTVLMERPL